MKKLSLFLFFLGLFSASESLRRQFRPGFINGTPLRDHYAKQFIDPDAYTDCLNNPEKFNVKRFNFTQPLDHFNSSETRKWSQQTQWRNDTFKPKSDGDIVFLLIGGEGPAPLPWMCFTSYTWSQLAVEHGAFMFQLEHRYFGTSVPTSDMSVPNLKWLTTEQALADFNAFIPAMNKMFNFNKPKWVAFGGSYPGTISALLRMVYPNITNGNIASSAPLWPKLDMWGGAHCVDMYPYTANSSSSIENPDVVNTINLVKQEVAYYLTLAGPFGGSNGMDTTPLTSMDTTIKATPLILIFGFVLCFVKLL
uniref:Serine protease n=1 Tax=Acrobeloides nanus TaxID=290746 RepID=A0A914CVB0_9BILA